MTVSGICGIIHFDNKPVDVQVLETMLATAAYRKSDKMVKEVHKNWALAGIIVSGISAESDHNRGHLILICDARIDNGKELLEKLSLPEKKLSYAELIVEAYGKWHQECPQHLLGDFAFCLWDNSNQTFFAARDVMGMRPLYYFYKNRMLIFASEVKQILATGIIDTVINEEMVAHYLTGQFEPLEWTFYQDIWQLPPGSAIQVSPDGLKVWFYWQPDYDKEIRYINFEEYGEHFREIFLESMRCRLRSEKPVGIFLSGGLDSGSMVSSGAWLLDNNQNKPAPELRAYCWAFDQLPECDERHISRIIIDHYRINFLDISADNAWPLHSYPRYGPDRDEPFIGTYQELIEKTLQAAQADGVGVMLSGDRGDLLTGMFTLDFVRLLKRGHFKSLLEALRAHHILLQESYNSIIQTYLLKGIQQELKDKNLADIFYWFLKKLFMTSSLPASQNIPDWIDSNFREKMNLQDSLFQKTGKTTSNSKSRNERANLIFSPLHMRGMVWSNRTNAKYGLGFADAWSDRRLVEFILAIPQQIINTPGLIDKKLTRESMRGIMPEAARNQARKIVPTPLYRQAITKLAKNTIISLINNSCAARYGFINERKLYDHYQTILNGGKEHPYFWWTLTLEMWLRQYWD